MKRTKFKAEEHIANLNSLKRTIKYLNRPFSKSIMIKGLKGAGLPCNDVFWMVFKSSGVIKEVSRGTFIFADDNPIHVSVLAAIYRKYKEKVCKYSKDYRDRKKNEKPKEESKEEAVIETVQLETTHELTEETAVQFLKNLGYVIYKPEVCIFYKKL
jgi:hypothetical protein